MGGLELRIRSKNSGYNDRVLAYWTQKTDEPSTDSSKLALPLTNSHTNIVFVFSLFFPAALDDANLRAACL